MGRSRRAAACAAVAAALLSAACTPDERDPQPAAAPVLGWVAGPGCATTPDGVRGVADGLVGSGLREAGYRTLLVACDRAEATEPLREPAVRDFLADRGFTLSVVGEGDERVRDTVDPTRPLPALRTAITRRAMAAEPLVFAAEPGTLDPRRTATVGKSEALAVDQDPRRTPGAPVHGDGDIHSRAVGEQGLVVSMTNPTRAARVMSVSLEDLGLVGDDTVAATDVWTGIRVHAREGALSMRVAPADSALLRIG